MKTKITVLMITARGDYTLVGMPSVHIFDLPLETFKRQSFKDFEFIVVDSLYEKRKNYFKEVEVPFPVKHIPPKHSPWIEKGLCHIANDWNTGIIHAEGELIVMLGDWTKPAVFSIGVYGKRRVVFSDFDSDYLSKIWSWYKKGHWAVSLSLFYQNVVAETVPFLYRKHYKKLFGEDPNGENIDRKMKVLDVIHQVVKPAPAQKATRIMDSRKDMLKNLQVAVLEPGAAAGFCAIPLEPLLDVNGVDELFDGCKCLEDTDLGYRLHLAGYRDRFIMDRELVVIEYRAKQVTPPSLYSSDFKSNYGPAMVNRNWKRWRANTTPLTNEQIEFVRKETVKWVRKPFDETREKMFQFWLANQPIFSLREEWEKQRGE